MTADSRVLRELQNLRHLEKHSQGSLSSNYIVQLLDFFTHKGPNGDHQCLVFELLGPTVDKILVDYHENNDKPFPETVLRISTQLLKAVRFIHNAGMCHGDISCRNIAFTCYNLLNITEEKLLGVLGFPEIEPLARIDGTSLEDGLPNQLVKAADWVEWIDEDDEEIRLLDIGESFVQGEEPEKLAQPGMLQVPETIFGDRFDYRIDLWRTGCTIYSFLLTAYPFWYLGENEAVIFQMIDFVDRLPSEWESQWLLMQMKSSHDLEVEEGGMSKLEQKIAEIVHEPSLEPLLQVTRGLMRFLLSSRIIADEALGLLCNTQE